MTDDKSQIMPFPRTVLICHSNACRKQGAAKVLAAFQAHPVPDVNAIASGCLGQCGNGPMVLVEPDNIWYNRVHPDEVPTVVERHLRGDRPVTAMLYQKKLGRREE
ncbi:MULTISPECIES: (2Fe-2S) ferredoxin domain-containing protein [Aerosakkonema]|uniref:(2Fe-2S) ferredoxin domain-containing protein n=1 Tax=Aerosakkonema TaxID=1246629 RepID=UPI0035B94C4A